VRTLVVLVLVLATACRYEGTYTCERNDQCMSAAAPGTCQLPVGLCSFPDPMCPSGQRFDDTAGSSAGVCVEPMVMIDAPAGFDPTTCPSTFTQLHASSPSRYRVLPALGMTAQFYDYVTACEMQKPGFTHAAIIETPAEAMVIAPLVTGPGGPTQQVYVGALQAPTATMPGLGWIHSDGTPVADTLWAQGEPNDANGGEGDHQEQVAVLTSAAKLNDIDMRMPWPILCECDGKAVSATFTAHVLTYRD